ncbi:PREDICTED: UPF0481 protein At3g47200-like [Tarenaya hassleriana]|uniref:UPF0481 protein At3g47200-like n=1 Tax=Tarenaya hassleriana TaxID=28532 RepID=UPI00053C68E2|nr:PREDICTED: UPF0481 protein At3g47200-like [Tarenaya hassleriana]
MILSKTKKKKKKQRKTKMNTQNPNSEPEDSHHLLSKTNVVPKLLKKSAGEASCCIFRVPDSLARNNHMAYRPKIVSIGPYHHGEKQLEMIQEHKHRFLEFFVSKSRKKGMSRQDLVASVSDLEEQIRGSYSENLTDFDTENLINMMVLDGCFVLTLFLVVAGKVRYSEINDPIFRIPWLLPAIRTDLLLLQNQVPFFLLQTLFEKSKLVSPSTGLNEIAFVFFGYSIERPEEFWSRHHNLDAKHLLDLIRKTFIPFSSGDKKPEHSCVRIVRDSKEESETETPKDCCFKRICGSKGETSSDARPFLRLILSARKLHLRGIKFRPKKNADTLLDIRYNNGVLEIPPLLVDDFISSMLLNFVVFEQFNTDTTSHITSYVAFLGCLINTEADATFLTDRGIIENYFGSEDEVSAFESEMHRNVKRNHRELGLLEVFEGINEYTSKGWHVSWAEFKFTHFYSPWTCISSCAALTLLLLTVIQAFFAAYSYFRPPKG